jgi:hypothetical protein
MSEQFPTTQITLLEQGIAISFNLATGLSLVASLSDDALFDIVHQVREARKESKKTNGIIQSIGRNSGNLHTN